MDGELLVQGQVLEGELAVAAAEEREEQGQVLEGELTVAADEERQESKQVEQHGNHRARSSPYPSRQFKHLVAGRSIGEGQATIGST